MDRMIRGVSKNARFVLLDTTEIVAEAIKIHNLNIGAAATFGRFLTGGLLMGSTLKGEDLLTLKTLTDGTTGRMVATVDGEGNVRGYLQNNNPNGEKLSDFVGKGTLEIIKDMGLKEPYVGVSEMTSGDIATDIAYYYYTSEQIPSVVSLGVSFDKEGNLKHAGGYMVQVLPDAEEDFIASLENKIGMIKTFTELREGGMSLERILKLIYEDITDETHEKLVEKYAILETKPVQYKCNCSKEKFHSGIVTLGKKEIEEIIKEEGAVEVCCQFCGTKYKFGKEEFENDF